MLQLLAFAVSETSTKYIGFNLSIGYDSQIVLRLEYTVDFCRTANYFIAVDKRRNIKRGMGAIIL